MRRRKRRQHPQDMISAQEIACFAYCPEQWRLQYGMGIEPSNQAAMAAGKRHHARKAVAERVASGSILLGLVLLAVTLLALLLLIFSR